MTMLFFRKSKLKATPFRLYPPSYAEFMHCETNRFRLVEDFKRYCVRLNAANVNTGNVPV
jgi:hypothetical protein